MFVIGTSWLLVIHCTTERRGQYSHHALAKAQSRGLCRLFSVTATPPLNILYRTYNSKNTQNNSYVEIVQFDKKHEKTLTGWQNHQKEILDIFMMQARIISFFFHGGFHVSHSPIYRVLTVFSLANTLWKSLSWQIPSSRGQFPREIWLTFKILCEDQKWIKNEGRGIHEHINQKSCMHLLLHLIKKNKIVFF